jgi:tetratricopeptide (TPR) repeat protein
MTQNPAWKPLAISLAAAGLLSAGLIAFGQDDDYFDPALLAGALCGPTAGSSLKPSAWLVLAQAEGQATTVATPGVADPPLYEDLGTLSYRVSTQNRLAQKYFDQGLRLTYAFNHCEAARAFRMAQKLDPDCAMCYWGDALVLGPNINLPMQDDAVAPAFTAIEKAKQLAGKASLKERALIEALSLRYASNPKADRAKLDAAYAEAMGKVAARYPNDLDIATLYTEALMDTQPWDYWEAGGSKPKGHAAEMVGTIEKVLKANPNHIGAIHYYIHITEASDQPKRALPYADRLAKLAPGAGHLVHMPAHSYYRVGRYLDSLNANKAAVEIDERYIAQQKPEGIYPFGYYPHNVHFVMVSAQVMGDAKTAIEYADKLVPLIPDKVAYAFPIAQPVKASPYFAYAQFAPPEQILGLAEPSADLPYVQALWHYARGIAQVGRRDFEAAALEAAAIADINKTANFADLNSTGIPAKDVLEVARHVVLGRIAQAKGDAQVAIGEFEQAVASEDRLSYTEPPYWYYPVRQSLGAALLQAGRVDQAEQAFRASLARTPNNGWSIYGLMQVYEKRGDVKAAKGIEKMLRRAWAGEREQLTLTHL